MAARSSGSLVKTASSRAIAPITTDASTMSARLDRAQAAPASRLPPSSKGSKRHPTRSRDNAAWGPPRQAWASTPAGTVGRIPRSSARPCRAQRPRSPFSAATNAPESYVIPRTRQPRAEHFRGFLRDSGDRSRSSTASASLNSLPVSRPCSRSQAFTARRPRSKASSCSAARDSQAERLTPAVCAACDADTATFSSSAMDSLRTAIPLLVAPHSYPTSMLLPRAGGTAGAA